MPKCLQMYAFLKSNDKYNQQTYEAKPYCFCKHFPGKSKVTITKKLSQTLMVKHGYCTLTNRYHTPKFLSPCSSSPGVKTIDQLCFLPNSLLSLYCIF